MSFSSDIKHELARIISPKACCKKAELSAILKLDGSFHILGQGRFAIHSACQDAATARKTVKLIDELFGLEHEVAVRKSSFKRGHDYLIYAPNQPKLNQALNEIGILDDKMLIVPSFLCRLVKRDCCAASYLRGAFLGGGSMGDPAKGYHFELNTDNFELANDLLSLFNRFEINAKLSSRRKNYMIYIKGSEDLSRLLALVGAHDTLLKLEDFRVVKDVKNSVNRLVNCDTANLKRSAWATVKQIKDIELIDKEVGLNNIPHALAQIASKRVEFPEANLSELGELCEPKLSKSAVYHRIRRIKSLASKLAI
ncbi:MAG: DNA-binding protein WhiA [Actinomycetota bacterium]|nr:DNA-binding protein WhiA [Actinomycetota bacterium]